MVWESPFYKFRVPKNENPESGELTELILDVTGSAPPFTDVKDTMKGVFEKLLAEEGKEITDILDFGAAKLRNTLYFLGKGKRVCAVEFEKLSQTSPDAKSILAECQKNRNFQNLLFPNPFINHKRQFELVLLINVLPVMPVFAERFLVLQVLYKKVKENKYVLWYAQKEGTDYKTIREGGQNRLGDGIWMGTNRRYKTFFKYNEVEDVDEMFSLNGFKFLKKFSAPGNDVRLYQKTEHNIFENVVNPEDIDECLKTDAEIEEPSVTAPKNVKKKNGAKEIVPNPSKLSIENLYRKALEQTNTGTAYAEKYHRIASHIIYRVFRGSLSNMDIKQEMDGGRKIIDTVYSNTADKGFFANLSTTFQIKCPYIIVEAKNYSGDPGNEEFDQLAGRLKNEVGQFGILVCRKVKDVKAAMDRCQGYLSDNGKHVIFLTDEDLINLLELYQDGDVKGINDFMDLKLRPLVFRAKK